MKKVLSFLVIAVIISACSQPQEVKDTREYIRDVHPHAKIGKAKAMPFRAGDLVRFSLDKTGRIPAELVQVYLYGDTTEVLGTRVVVPVRYAGQNMDAVFFYNTQGRRIDGDLFVSK